MHACHYFFIFLLNQLITFMCFQFLLYIKIPSLSDWCSLSMAWFWNLDQVVWSNRKNYEPLNFAVFLASRIALLEKSGDPCKLWSERTVLRIVTDFWGSDGFFLFQLFWWILANTSVWSYVRSRKNEKEMKEHKEEQRSEGDLIISDLEQRDS